MYLCASVNTIEGFKVSFHLDEVNEVVLVECDGRIMAEYSTENVDDSLLVQWLMVISCGGGEYFPQEVREVIDNALMWHYECED